MATWISQLRGATPPQLADRHVAHRVSELLGHNCLNCKRYAQESPRSVQASAETTHTQSVLPEHITCATNFVRERNGIRSTKHLLPHGAQREKQSSSAVSRPHRLVVNGTSPRSSARRMRSVLARGRKHPTAQTSPRNIRVNADQTMTHMMALRSPP